MLIFSCSSITSGVSFPITYFSVIFFFKLGSRYNFKNGFLTLTPVRSNVCKWELNASYLASVIKLPSSLRSFDLEISRKVNVAFTPISLAKDRKALSLYKLVFGFMNSDKMWIPSFDILLPISDSSTNTQFGLDKY
jgi:hypothetical protein